MYRGHRWQLAGQSDLTFNGNMPVHVPVNQSGHQMALCRSRRYEWQRAGQSDWTLNGTMPVQEV